MIWYPTCHGFIPIKIVKSASNLEVIPEIANLGAGSLGVWTARCRFGRTGGIGCFINGWDLRQGRMGSPLSPTFNVEGWQTPGFNDSAYAMTSVGSHMGNGSSQLLTGAFKQDVSTFYKV